MPKIQDYEQSEIRESLRSLDFTISFLSAVPAGTNEIAETILCLALEIKKIKQHLNLK